MSAYYNEIDPHAAQWLRNLIAAGHIAPGDVDERSIELVTPEDLAGYTQCHFFAGIGVWSYALRAAGWDDSRPVWTGSCPCQPFSAAGRALGHKDERHLWPTWFRLIRERRPRVVFGEQVASRDGLAWLDVVSTDLEAEAYAVGALDTCAAGVGAPHIRQRLFFVADARRDGARQHARELSRDEGKHAERPPIGNNAPLDRGTVGSVADAADADRRARERRAETGTRPNVERRLGSPSRRAHGDMADASDDGSQGRILRRPDPRRQVVDGSARCDGAVERMADPNGTERRPLAADRGNDFSDASERDKGASRARERGAACDMGDAAGRGFGEPRSAPRQTGRPAQPEPVSHVGDADGGLGEGCRALRGIQERESPEPARGPTNGFWRAAEWIPCIDGKARPVEPGTFPLAYGATARVVRLRAYGNAINAEVARTFIAAYLEHEREVKS